MKRSTDRILTTHVGSLPRPTSLIKMIMAKDREEPVDEAVFSAELARDVDEVVKKQVDVGLDIINDGEYGKRGFNTYVNERLGGTHPTGKARRASWGRSREYTAFPEFYGVDTSGHTQKSRRLGRHNMEMAVTEPLIYKGKELLARDLGNLRHAMDVAGAEEAFVPAISACDIFPNQVNKYYKSDEEFLFAIADAMHEEYKTIVDAGFLVQIDDPNLITYYMKEPDASIADCRKWAERQVEAINHSIRDIPREKIRYHSCYSIDVGPRVHDMEMRHMLDIILRVKAGAFSFEAANPRHAHEWRLWEDHKLPDGAIMIPGVITNSTVVVEHPELVADRICQFANLVGRENVIAGGDCGFAAVAKEKYEIHPSIVWAKFKAMAEGAEIATKRLWG